MTLPDNLKLELRKILMSRKIPIQAARNWASRNTNIATGTSGLEFALIAPEKGSYKILALDSSISNIFESDFRESDQGYILRSTEKNRLEAVLGDVFEGECNRLWTHLTLGFELTDQTNSQKPGAVIRPGIGHGDVIRSFYKWYFEGLPNKEEFETSEDAFQGIGWCNGLAGLLATQGLVDVLLGKREPSPATRRNLANLIQALRGLSEETESGLCHGVSGALVVATGVSRVFDLRSEFATLKNIESVALNSNSPLSLPDNLDVDSSWITGSAGLVWATSVLQDKPIFNPLFPPDSLSFTNASLKKIRL